MSVQSEIERIKGNISAAYRAVREKGGTAPAAADSENLAAAVSSIPGGDGGGSPVGTVISYMGTTAPAGYLVCDGAVKNISDYPALARHFEDQFGSVSYFGGDGSTTFALPDMRNLFLRGFHGSAAALSREVGKRQDGTVHTNLVMQNQRNVWAGILLPMSSSSSSIIKSSNRDTETPSSVYDAFHITANSPDRTLYDVSSYTARPVNMAVLYCIKAVGNAGDNERGIPAGSVIMWSGSEEDIPSGWALCDGQAGRPDLRDRFVLGAGTAHPVGETGGEEDHVLTEDEMPEHVHNAGTLLSSSIGGGWYAFAASTSTSAKKFFQQSSSQKGASQPHNNMPPYYVMCYIIKL